MSLISVFSIISLISWLILTIFYVEKVMIPLDSLMNLSVQLVHSENVFHRRASSRLLSVVCIPTELAASLENLIRLPFQTAGYVLRAPVKVLNAALRSRSLKEFESRLPTPSSLLKTALKVVGFVIGSVFTSTLGVFAPEANFKLHHFLGLVSDKKAEEEARLKRAQEEADKAAVEAVQTSYLQQVAGIMKHQGLQSANLLQQRLQAIQASPSFETEPVRVVRPAEEAKQEQAEPALAYEQEEEPQDPALQQIEDFPPLDQESDDVLNELPNVPSPLVLSESLA